MLKLPSLKPPGKPKPLNLKTPSLETAQPATAQSETDQPAADVPDDQQRTAAEAYQEATAAGVADQQPAAETAQQSVSEAYDIDSTGVHTRSSSPARCSSVWPEGELKAQEPAVEVDGLTSDEAKTTQDFNVQFEVARHPELLAFLAMNPYLYDDMYSWLAARGEADIDKPCLTTRAIRNTAKRLESESRDDPEPDSEPESHGRSESHPSLA